MKLLLVISLSACSFTAFGQVDQDEVVKQKLEELYREGMEGDKLRRLSLPRKPDETFPQLAEGVLIRKPGVYALPQDRMPCIVPDTGGIVAIPNAFPSVVVPFRTTIPNAWQGPSLKGPTKK